MSAPESVRTQATRAIMQALLLLAFTIALIALGDRSARAFLQLHPGQPGDEWALSGFHASECNATECFRWSQPAARIFLYEVDGDNALLTLRLGAPPRADHAPARLSISAAGHTASTFEVTQDWRRYHIVTPIQGTSDTTLVLRSAPYHPSGKDTRALGVALSALDFRPLSGLTRWRASFLLLMPLAGWWLMWVTGARPLAAFSVGVALAILSGWSAAAPIQSGYWLPTLGWPQGRLAPIVGLLLAPLGIRWLYGRVPGRLWSGLALIAVALLALRLMNAVAAGLILLLVGTLLLVARAQSPRAARSHISLRNPKQGAAIPSGGQRGAPAIGGDGKRELAPAIPALTGIRFFAAFAVVLFHYQRLIPYPAPVQALIERGQASVGLFFILSGFILVYNYYDWFRADTTRYWEYVRARFARIVPVYALALLLATPLVLYYILADPVNNTDFRDLELSWIANLLLIHVYFPIDQVQTLWNGPSWSVAAECFFYAIFPLFVCSVLSRFTRARALLLLAIGLFGVEVLAFAISLGALGWMFPEPEAFTLALVRFVHKSPFLRVWEFLIGATLGAIYLLARAQPVESRSETPLPRFAPRASRDAVFPIPKPNGARPQAASKQRPEATSELAEGPVERGARAAARVRSAALALALLALPAIALAPGLPGVSRSIGDALHWYVLYTPFFALIIFTLAAGPTFATRFLSHPWIVRLGEASYALYILHSIPRNLLPLVLPPGASRATTIVLSLLAIAGSVVASLLVYTWVETPARRWLRGSRAQRDSSAVVAAPAGAEISQSAP
jgi:peptidoglycan/LPS O-acetylase OafA/YrhL